MLVHLCHHVSPVDQSADTHLEERRRKQHWQSGKVKKKKKKERERSSFMVRAAGPQRKAGGRQTDLHCPHLSPPLGFWFNKDGTFLMFIGQH